MKRIIIAGLGNPGTKYSNNRHNVGFMVIDALLDHFQISANREKWEAQLASIRLREFDETELLLLKPLTFMNLSGKPVSAVARFHHVQPEQILIIHDEIEIPFAELRFKVDGGHKGHNGLRDIIARCGCKNFHRLRVGVGRPNHPNIADYLLSDFAKSEEPQLEEMIVKSRDMTLEWLTKTATALANT